jgi:NADPH:quinone reductase-like Zn-dependent oxidoreductase
MSQPQGETNGTNMMKVQRFYPPGGTEKLKYECETVPKPSKGEVLIKVKAVGLMWSELSWPVYRNSDGKYFSHIPGHDFSGIIEATGPEVDAGDEGTTADLKVGSEVYAFTSRRNHEGAMAEYALSDLAQVLPKPQNLSFLESASVPLSALTAWQALFDHGNLQAGQKLLITGAAGATGIWAVQFGRMAGAHVIATGLSKRSEEVAKELGADQFVKYKEVPSLETTIQDVDLVLDCVGGKVFEQCLKVVKKEGLLISVCNFDCKTLAERQGVRGLFFIVNMNAEELAKITKLVEKGTVRPVVDSVVPLEETASAFVRAADGHNHGRVVISVP